MKQILILIIGLLVVCARYDYTVHNNGIAYKIPRQLIVFTSFFLFSSLISRFQNTSYYKSLEQLFTMAIATYGTFDSLPFVSLEDKHEHSQIQKILYLEKLTK